MVVLDTAALLYWTLDPERLPEQVAVAIASADRVLVSSISVWEIGLKVKRGRLHLPVSVREFAERLRGVARVEVLGVDELLWIENLELPWAHEDPADRTVVALAQRMGCPLVTPDAAIGAFYPMTVW